MFAGGMNDSITRVSVSVEPELELDLDDDDDEDDEEELELEVEPDVDVKITIDVNAGTDDLGLDLTAAESIVGRNIALDVDAGNEHLGTVIIAPNGPEPRRLPKDTDLTHSHWHRHENVTGEHLHDSRKLILVNDVKRTWVGAQKHCRKMGGDLVSIADEEENKAVRNFYKNDANDGDRFWTGAYEKEFKDGKWRWTDKTKFRYENFADG